MPTASSQVGIFLCVGTPGHVLLFAFGQLQVVVLVERIRRLAVGGRGRAGGRSSSSNSGWPKPRDAPPRLGLAAALFTASLFAAAFAGALVALAAAAGGDLGDGAGRALHGRRPAALRASASGRG